MESTCPGVTLSSDHNSLGYSCPPRHPLGNSIESATPSGAGWPSPAVLKCGEETESCMGKLYGEMGFFSLQGHFY